MSIYRDDVLKIEYKNHNGRSTTKWMTYKPKFPIEWTSTLEPDGTITIKSVKPKPVYETNAYGFWHLGVKDDVLSIRFNHKDLSKITTEVKRQLSLDDQQNVTKVLVYNEGDLYGTFYRDKLEESK